jgi:hypothetical protein
VRPGLPSPRERSFIGFLIFPADFSVSVTMFILMNFFLRECCSHKGSAGFAGSAGQAKPGIAEIDGGLHPWMSCEDERAARLPQGQPLTPGNLRG